MAKRRSKLFRRRKDADVFLVKVRSLVANHTYLADSDSTTVTEAAKSWLDHCEVRCKTGRRMERSTLRGYSDYLRLHLTKPVVGIADKLIAFLITADAVQTLGQNHVNRTVPQV